MSTRTAIIFVDGDEQRRVYKHHDGYPSNIVPLLNDFFEALSQSGQVRDVGYAAAAFIKYDLLRTLRRDMNVDLYDLPKDSTQMLTSVLGGETQPYLEHGVLGETIPSDVAYTYRVNVSRSPWRVKCPPEHTGEPLPKAVKEYE